MQCDRTGPPAEFSEGCDHIERVQVMLAQDDDVYRCSDYLSIAALSLSSSTSSKETSACMEVDKEIAATTHSEIDAVCRERMCEWSLRVSDHFQVPRQTVALSFNFLDRFVEKCQCDRSAFKLTAMTTLYMASKICGSSHKITIQSLVELSRGEFEKSHIQEMETIILQTLGWRLNPPTAQCFIDNFYNFLPVPQGPVSTAIYQRATFFAELALYDYAFVAQNRALIALAALTNAMEGLNESAVSSQQQDSFAKVICMTFHLKFTHEDIEAVRNRLWYVYSMSAQYKEDDAISPDVVKRDSHRKQNSEDAMQIEPSCPSCSPVSVVGPLT
jgi:hypothetical protein